MEKFTNTNIKKENRFMIKRLIAFIIVLAISFVFAIWRQEIIDTVNNEMTDLDSIIVSSEEKTNKKAYVDVKAIPYEFAVSEETINSYFMIFDGTYLYIAYMSPSDFEQLNNEEIENNPVRIEGITYEITDEIKEIAIEAYNEGLEENEQIADADFNSYFGSVYLNTTVDESDVGTLQLFLFLIFFLIGLIGTVLSAYELIRFRRSISKMDISLIEELDSEMNNPDAFYYEKAHLYLTNKYIINFNNRFVVIDYQDIVWMYPYTRRTNGIKTTQSIRVQTEEGKTYTIAEIEFITKAKKEAYNEIWNTIVSKNNKIVLGYTQENIKEMKERFRKKKI